MRFLGSGAGLKPEFRTPPQSPEIDEVHTEEAAICPPVGASVHVTPLVNQGEVVARGSAVACLRHAPDVCFTAPISGRVARISLLPGKKLSEIVLFREDGGDERHETDVDTPAALRRLLQGAGVWPLLRRRPFGSMPGHDETPVAIFVMAADTRPHAPDPEQALTGREQALSRGLGALARLTDGPIFLCVSGRTALTSDLSSDRVRVVARGVRHPQASAGICIHGLCPAGLEAPVWDIHAEDVAAVGDLLETGVLPVTRLVRIAGAGLREGRLLRTHPGADLRQLTQRIVAPGGHSLMSGSPLDGHSAHWLAPRHRQVTVLPRAPARRRRHWLIEALTQDRGAEPVIPTAALTQALGDALPAAAFVRGLGSGDDETSMRLGLLSLLEEDLALADYVLRAHGHLMAQQRAMLDRIRTEFAA